MKPTLTSLCDIIADVMKMKNTFSFIICISLRIWCQIAAMLDMSIVLKLKKFSGSANFLNGSIFDHNSSFNWRSYVNLKCDLPFYLLSYLFDLCPWKSIRFCTKWRIQMMILYPDKHINTAQI